MIKLLDNPKLLDKLALSEPYLGCLFTATAEAFCGDLDLMTIWVETDERGETVSALNLCSNEIMFLSGKNKSSLEMLLFLTKLSENEEIKTITCGENSLPMLKKIFGENVASHPLMKCSKHIKYDSEGLSAVCEDNSADLYEILTSHLAGDVKPDREMFMLKILRERMRGQSTVLTLEKDNKAISTACIRGRTKSAGAIVSVITLPEYRGRGYATFLVSQLAEMLRNEKRTAWLSPENEAAEKIYTKLGFTATEKLYTITLDK